MICPQCGTNVDETVRFCPVCGAQMNHQQQPFSDPAPQAPVPPTAYQPPYRGGPVGYQAPIQNRNIALCIFLSLITCGIYGLYWIYCVVTDLNTASGEFDDTSGGMVILLNIVTCGIYM